MITLLKETPREAVCKVFENVNTGGVSLTVFELVTASFATNVDIVVSNAVAAKVRGSSYDFRKDCKVIVVSK